MPNSILTPTAVTREALAVLHQKLNFIGNINRTYDKQFAVEGAKIGSTVNVRLPNQYVTRDGANLSAQDTTETSVPLAITNQTGVDLNFTSQDLTLSLQDFSARILEPAMSVLAATLESRAYAMALDVYQNVNNIGSAASFKSVLQARKVLQDALAPVSERSVTLNTQDNVDMVDTLKGLFNDSTTISKQNKEGMLGRTGGFDFYENTLIPTQATGTSAAVTGYTINGAALTGASIAVTNGANPATTFKKGDIVTFSGVNRVHPETKADTGSLQQFVVTADYAGGAGNLAISPAIVVSGGRQNVTASPANGAAVSKVGGASAVYRPSLAFHKDAFAFATADLVMPQGVDFAAREVMDGLSMRIVRQYSISNDQFPTRLDVLWGAKTIRPELACRILSN